MRKQLQTFAGFLAMLIMVICTFLSWPSRCSARLVIGSTVERARRHSFF
ncbi:MAG: hypothetical protein ABI210_04040 [Abditibacteriaceae bacterium]